VALNSRNRYRQLRRGFNSKARRVDGRSSHWIGGETGERAASDLEKVVCIHALPNVFLRFQNKSNIPSPNLDQTQYILTFCYLLFIAYKMAYKNELSEVYQSTHNCIFYLSTQFTPYLSTLMWIILLFLYLSRCYISTVI